MLRFATLSYCAAGQIGRISPLSKRGERIAGVELLSLVCAGGLAAAAIAFIPLQMQIPGHAILKAALPMVFGVAMVPRRGAGTVAGLAAAGAVGAFFVLNVGNMQPAAVIALLAIGPAIDIALNGAKKAGWRLYLRFALAGLLANLVSFAVRWGTASFHLDSPRPHALREFGFAALASFALCGLAAGLISAVVCFRASVKSTGSEPP